MTSSTQVLLNCSIHTLISILEDKSLAKRLIETRALRMIPLHLPEFDIASQSDAQIVLHYSTTKESFTYYFDKVSNNVVKCRVENNFRWGLWLAVAAIFLCSYFFTQNELFAGLSWLTIAVMIVIALYHYWGINSLCKRVKKNYENNADFLALFDWFAERESSLKVRQRVNEAGMQGSGEPVYYLHNGHKQEGPYTLTELNGRLMSGLMVWKAGTEDWQPVASFPELLTYLPSVPPPFKGVKAAPPTSYKVPTPPNFTKN